MEKTMENTSHNLNVNCGAATDKGVKPLNEDAVGLCVPDNNHQLKHKGVCLLVADGVSTAEAGQEASESTVNNFIEDYYNTPDTWSVGYSAENIVSAINLRLFRKSLKYKVEGKGFLCTLCAVVIKSRTAHVFHVGDSRVYLLRNGELKQLTQDHSVTLRKGEEFLSRAVGMDSQLHLEYNQFPLEENDILLCSSDGLHTFMDDNELISLLSQPGEASARAANLVKKALENGSDDNISATIGVIDKLDEENIDDYNARLTRLPFPPALEAGMKLDGFEVLGEIYASSRSQLYKVRDSESGDVMVMKTPSLNYEGDNHYIDRFIQEEWVGKRISSPYLVEVKQVKREKKFLYYLLELVDGVTLEQWIADNPQPDPAIAINIVEQIALGLSALHRNDTVHQDLRPANIMINADNRIKIVDFGSVYVASLAEVFTPIRHEGVLGTASYADPNYLLGKNSATQGDLYALATITYELFTSHLPYGEGVEECRTAADYDRLRYHTASQYNHIIPLWFDRALEKGVKFDLEQRYFSIADFIKDLKNPNPDFLRDDPKIEMARSPLLFWQLMSAFWILMLLLMVVLFSAD
ncbi:protein kinase domain-containing protein [Bacterioplanoides sp.]|uniref:protein kinase domain-containing protein n=1 Tax=Bacterioplanoides sp. TaxID=2066072 RepID=UPI003B5A6FE0